MGGKGSGSIRGAHEVDPKANSRAIRYARALWDLPQIDLGDPEAVEDRIDLFFDMCEEHGVRPLLGNLAASFDMSTESLKHLVYGTRSGCKLGVTPQTLDLIKKAHSYVSLVFEQIMMTSKNPVPAIYYSKAIMDWREAPNETVITHRSDKPQLSAGSADEVRRKYAEIVGVEEAPAYELPPGEEE